MSTTFNDPVIINDTLDVAASGAKTTASTAVEIENSATSTTASIDKIAAKIASTGTWSGSGARNYGLKIEPTTGGASNWDVWCGETTSFTAASQEFFPTNKSVFAVRNTAAVAPALFLSESNANEVTSLNAVAVATDGTTDVIGLWSQAVNEGATLSSLAAIQGILSGSDGSVVDAVCLWANGTSVTPPEFSITNLYGVRVEPLEGATNNFAIQTNQSADSNNYAIYNLGDAKSYFGGNVGVGTTSPESRLDIDDGALTLAEMTAPSAPASNKCVIYAEDNGTGKTRLMARFATGSAIQLAIEP